MLGLIGAVPLSVIFGIAALAKIRRTRQPGKGLAIAGLLLSAGWALGFLAAVNFAAHHSAGSDSTGSDMFDSHQVNAFHLKAGSCFNRPLGSRSAEVDVVPCAEPHDAELFAMVSVPGGPYPGETSLKATAERECGQRVAGALAEGVNYPDLQVRFFVPLKSSWIFGVQRIDCLFRGTAGPLTGPVRDIGVPFTADQQRYRSAVRRYNTLIVAVDATPVPPWTTLRTLSGELLLAGQDEARQLAAKPWPARAQPAVNALLRSKQVELRYWRQAAAGRNAAEVLRAVDGALTHNGSAEAMRVRDALGIVAR